MFDAAFDVAVAHVVCLWLSFVEQVHGLFAAHGFCDYCQFVHPTITLPAMADASMSSNSPPMFGMGKRSVLRSRASLRANPRWVMRSLSRMRKTDLDDTEGPTGGSEAYYGGSSEAEHTADYG